MTTLRLISTLRSSLLTIKCRRGVLPFSRISFRSIPDVPTQQLCLFSSSTIVHARRRDKIDADITEDLENEDEDEDIDTDQVR
jgi:hypothetical protein